MDEVKAFVERNRENIIRDVKRLVNIRSVSIDGEGNAPYGKEVRAVEDEAIAICRECGLDAHDVDGRIAYAHTGAEKYIGIVAHADVVPEGDGWHSDPFDCIEKDGNLVGRGTADDKGPLVAGIYAAKYFAENGGTDKYGVRVIVGLDEERGMSDIVYYLEKCAAPAFAFTPDHEFPVSNGEKGIFVAELSSKPLGETVLHSLSGGTAHNIVCDFASASVSADYFNKLLELSKSYAGISVTADGGECRIEARGKSAHAAAPENSDDANNKLERFLLDSSILSPAENEALEFMCRSTERFDGSGFAIACDDGIFTPLTIVGGIIELKDGKLTLVVDSRYPTCIAPDELESKVAGAAADGGFEMKLLSNSAPYYLEPDTNPIQALLETYEQVTGFAALPYVMSGGTYARRIKNCVVFGAEDSNIIAPEWVGAIHTADEAFSVEQLLTAVELFIRSIQKLQMLEL